MREELLIALLSTFNKDKNCLMSFELATEHLSDEELLQGVKKCLALHNKPQLLPSDLNKYALSERIEKARNTLYKVSRRSWDSIFMGTFSDLILCILVERSGGIEFFTNKDDDYFFNDWGIKSFSDKYLEIATSPIKSYKRYIFNEANALAKSDEVQPAICYVFDEDGNPKTTRYNNMQLALRSDSEKQQYLAECKSKENLKNILVKVIV